MVHSPVMLSLKTIYMIILLKLNNLVTSKYWRGMVYLETQSPLFQVHQVTIAVVETTQLALREYNFFKQSTEKCIRSTSNKNN